MCTYLYSFVAFFVLDVWECGASAHAKRRTLCQFAIVRIRACFHSWFIITVITNEFVDVYRDEKNPHFARCRGNTTDCCLWLQGCFPCIAQSHTALALCSQPPFTFPCTGLMEWEEFGSCTKSCWQRKKTVEMSWASLKRVNLPHGKPTKADAGRSHRSVWSNG